MQGSGELVMRRLVVMAAVVLVGCTQRPSGTVYLDPTYDLTGSEPPADTLETLEGVFAGVKFGGSTAPLREPEEDDRLSTGRYRPFGAPEPLPAAEPFVGPPAPPASRADAKGQPAPTKPAPDPKPAAP
jgi:hypothetical protein